MRKALFFISFILVLLIINCGEKSEPLPGQHPQVFQKGITKIIRTGYLLFLPKDYFDQKKEWPMMLFLHGSGERGDDLDLVKKHGPPKIVQEKEDFPFIVVSPQCPKMTGWSFNFMVSFINSLVDEIVSKYRIDEDRIYVTGLSGGGHGAWSLVTTYPYKFAAVATVCPARSPAHKACIIKHIPVWIFHNTKDHIVPINRSEEMVKALKECGANVKFTVYEEPYYPEHPHDAWTEAYSNPELYEWFLSHRRVKSD